MLRVCMCFALISVPFAYLVAESSRSVEKYLILQRSRNPELTDVELAHRVILNTSELISVCPDHQGLSGFYSLSQEEKDSFLISCETNKSFRVDRLRRLIEETSPDRIPESATLALIRLGLESKINLRCGTKAKIVSVEDFTGEDFGEVSYGMRIHLTNQGTETLRLVDAVKRNQISFPIGLERCMVLVRLKSSGHQLFDLIKIETPVRIASSGELSVCVSASQIQSYIKSGDLQLGVYHPSFGGLFVPLAPAGSPPDGAERPPLLDGSRSVIKDLTLP